MKERPLIDCYRLLLKAIKANEKKFLYHKFDSIRKERQRLIEVSEKEVHEKERDLMRKQDKEFYEFCDRTAFEVIE